MGKLANSNSDKHIYGHNRSTTEVTFSPLNKSNRAFEAEMFLKETLEKTYKQDEAS